MSLNIKFKDCMVNAENFEKLYDYWNELYEDPAKAIKEFIESFFYLTGWNEFKYDRDFLNLETKINRISNYKSEDIITIGNGFIPLLKKFISKMYTDNNGKVFQDVNFANAMTQFLKIACCADLDSLRMIAVVIGFEILTSMYQHITSNTFNEDHPVLSKYFISIFTSVLRQGAADIDIDVNLEFAYGMQNLTQLFPFYMIKEQWLTYWNFAIGDSYSVVAIILLEALKTLFENQINDLSEQIDVFQKIREDLVQIVHNKTGTEQYICLSIIIEFDKLYEIELSDVELTILYHNTIKKNVNVAQSSAMFLIKKGYVRTSSTEELFYDIMWLADTLNDRGKIILIVESFYELLSQIPWIEWINHLKSLNRSRTFGSLLFWYAKKSVQDYESPARARVTILNAEDKQKNQLDFMNYFTENWCKIIEDKNIKKDEDALLAMISLVEMLDHTITVETGIKIATMLKKIITRSQNEKIIARTSLMLRKLHKMERLRNTISCIIIDLAEMFTKNFSDYIKSSKPFFQRERTAAKIIAFTTDHFFEDEKLWNLAFRHIKCLNLSEVKDKFLVVLCIEILFNLLNSALIEYHSYRKDCDKRQSLHKIILKRTSCFPTAVVPCLESDEQLIRLAAFTAMSKMYYDFGRHTAITPQLAEFSVISEGTITEKLAQVFKYIPKKIDHVDLLVRSLNALKNVTPLFVKGVIPVENFYQLIFVHVSTKYSGIKHIVCNSIEAYRNLNINYKNGLASALLRAIEEFETHFGSESSINIVETMINDPMLFKAVGRTPFIQLFFTFIEKIIEGKLEYDDYLQYFVEQLGPGDVLQLIQQAATMPLKPLNVSQVIQKLTLKFHMSMSY